MQENPQGYHTDKLETVSFYVCITCGTQFSPSVEPPAACPICEDDRQYVGLDGQKWTTLDELRQRSRERIRSDGSRRHGHPDEAFVCHRTARVSDRIAGRQCPVGLRDPARSKRRKSWRFAERGGWLRSRSRTRITTRPWSTGPRRFDVPVYLHAADRQWVMRRESASPILGRRDTGRCTTVSRSSGPAGTSKAARAPLPRSRRRQRSPVLGRHHPGGSGSPLGQLYVQLSRT